MLYEHAQVWTVLSIAVTVALNFRMCFSACARAEYKMGQDCCPKCAPGNRVYWDCTIDASTTCVPCPALTYTDEPNGLNKCFPCTVCITGEGLRVKTACTRSSDTVCEPLEGFYCTEPNKDNCRSALKHSDCHPGQYIKQAGTAFTDTVCGKCTEGSFSNGSFTTCRPHSTCETEGRVIKPGTVSSDAECGHLSPVLIVVGTITGGVVLFSAVGISFIYFKLKQQKCQHPPEGKTLCLFKK
ncbi:tumor necrosis factor receptor superfamily member 14-like [Garra rufa]|uniref:tumor necrosis factor receptor superfamily member 14-like n=1 Tax=Garra rufa TaxID=137080 RepID=UPI003CCE663F